MQDDRRVETDWAGLWRELCEVSRQREAAEDGQDAWTGRSRRHHARTTRRWAKPDSSRQTIAAMLAAAPGATLLDIGAGTGAWAAYFAPFVARITAVEPSPAMLDVLQETLADQDIRNVDVLQAAWPDADVEEHDFSFCSHAMYGHPDLPAFVRRMEQVTRRTCFLVLRAPSTEGVMAEAALHLWGHPYDSPNFQIAYNVLLRMGIRPNVLFEDAGLWQPWTSDTLPDALAEVKRRLALNTTEHDAFLTDLLRRRLREEDGRFVWPPGVRSALVYWQVERD